MPEWNIVQAEFFHFQSNSIEGIWNESFERKFEGGRIKTVVRFYDRTTEITAQVSAYAEFRASQQRTYCRAQEVPTSDRATWNTLEREFGALRDTMHRVRGIAQTLALRELRAGVREYQPLAIEEHGCRFRSALPNERHDLLERAGAARSSWFFVFEPNDLLAGTLTKIASMM